MMRTYLFVFFLLLISFIKAQEISSSYIYKRAAVSDTILIDTVSISPYSLKVFDMKDCQVDSTFYTIDFQKGRLYLKNRHMILGDSILIKYVKYPHFITKKYRSLTPNVIVDHTGVSTGRYALSHVKKNTFPELFGGLNANGSISRSITVGNNQNAVLNSQLDLQISGKIANNMVLRAAIKDASIPLQENGYSQRLDEFDQIFITLESNNWKVRAGDVNLVNDDTYFMQFSKKIQGVSLAATLKGNNTTTEVFGSGALVRGDFSQSQFQGEEGNQGPYKLTGPRQELFILIVSGSERVYVNGIQLQRGENQDYIIDYNAAEIVFTSRYPITSDMRILVEYQYTNNNFSRFVTYAGATHQTEKVTIGTYLYSENDAKNQPLLQNLSQEQVRVLSNAGDDTQLMVASSAISDTYSENKILYRKELRDGVPVFVYANNPEEALYNVRFTAVGTQQGNYTIVNNSAIGKIYAYVAPVNGIPQGDYAPVIMLNAPEKFQMTVLRGAYHPSEKTMLSFETALSNNDRNLFSTIDDKDNRGFAGRVAFKQHFFKGAWRSDFFINHDYVTTQFRNIEGLYQIEFNRDWNLSQGIGSGLQNLSSILGDQILLSAGIALSHPDNGQLNYRFEYLDLNHYASGSRHIIDGVLPLKKIRIQTSTSILKNQAMQHRSAFTRLYTKGTYNFNTAWTGVVFHLEDNQQREITTDRLTPISQRFNSYHAFLGVGDSTRIFAEAGYIYRINDSIKNYQLERFNRVKTYYIKSQFFSDEDKQLSAFVSFRDFDYTHQNIMDERSLNSRVRYSQKFFNTLIETNAVYEMLSGTLPQQEFTYLEVAPGQGTYTWIDYNSNTIQELNEFELAQFPDEAMYIRVLLPNQVFIKTSQNKFSQTLTFNFGQWINDKGFKKLWSHFYNQTSYLIDRKVKRNLNRINVNPFSPDNENLLGLNQQFRNTLFFNRGKQHYTASYTYLHTRSKNLLSIGAQENSLESHQLQFTHQFNEFWVANLVGTTSNTESIAENFINRNYRIRAHIIYPKISYLFNQNSRFDVFYQYESKDNTLGLEQLQQQRIGASFAYANAQKVSLNGEINFFKNDFNGNSFSPVGYQLLEGLQPGNNFTWNALVQKRITKFLDLNLSYFGRSATKSRTIHTGSVQLKAYF